MIDPIEDMLNRHSDAEIVQYLYTKAIGVQQGYRKALKDKSPEYIWSMVGAQAEITTILGRMHRRNQERLAQAEQMQHN